MNKADLISIVEPRVGSRKVATDVVESIFDAVIREVAGGGKVAITGFRHLRGRRAGAADRRNPRTGEPVPIRKTVAPGSNQVRPSAPSLLHLTCSTTPPAPSSAWSRWSDGPPRCPPGSGSTPSCRSTGGRSRRHRRARTRSW